MPVSHPRGGDGARPRAARRPLLLLAAAACVIPVAAPVAAASAASAAPSYRLTRSDVALHVDQGVLGAWFPLKARQTSSIGFESDGSGDRVLRLADSPDGAGYVAITTPLNPKTVVTVHAEIDLLSQQLRRGKVRSLLAITGRDGTSYQAGVYRAPRGYLRWALWTKDPAGGIRNLGVADLAVPGAFHELTLTSRWGGANARAVLSLDGKAIARTASRQRSAAGTRVIIGLGRVSKKTETGSMLVRSARVSTAAPTAIGGAAGGGGGGAGTPAAPPAADAPLPGKTIFRGDFETGSISQWAGFQRVADDRISVVRSPVRQGSYAARFEVRNGDNPIGFGDRAEVQSSTHEAEGQDRWYSWSTMFAADFPRTSAWQVVSQWHADADGSPPLGFYAQNDDIQLQANRFSGPGSPLSTEIIWHGPMRRGLWNDIRIHVKWSGSDSTGFVELWVNGVRQTFDDGSTHRAIRTLVPGVGAYFKQGLYRQSGVSGTGVIYHDGLQVTQVN